MRFKQRKELADKYREWVKQSIDNNQTMILDCTESVIAFLDINGYLNEVVRGEWIYHPEKKNVYGGKAIECSHCHTQYVVQYIEDELFCRNCGARMEEDNERE